MRLAFTPNGRMMGSVAALLVLTTACDESLPTDVNEDPDVATLTVDASSDWAFVSLGDSAQEVQVADPGTSSGWDIAFNGTRVMLNGGAAGPGGVDGVCLCENLGLSDAQVQELTAEGELSAFQAVDAAGIPTDAWEEDVLVPAIDGWYSYDMDTHVVSAAPENSWKIRASDGTTFAKFRVIELNGSSQADAGEVTFEYALQASRDSEMGAVQTATVNVSEGGEAYFSFVDDAPGDASSWDLHFEGYTIRVNGGVSGSAGAGASTSTVPFGDVTDAGDLTDRHYNGDAFGGVFATSPWYRYNLDGNHQIWPTFGVYLVRRGGTVYKVQLIGYYDEAGDARHITIRYAGLTE